MRHQSLFIVTDRHAVFTAGMSPAQWVRGQRRELEWLGFLRRHSAWLKSFAAMSPHLHPDQALWGDALPALLGEWTQQTKLVKEAQQKPGSKSSPAPLAETQWLKDFSRTGEDKRRTRRNRSQPPSSRIGQAAENLRQRTRAFPSVTSHIAPITDQPSPAAERPLPSGKPQPHRLQSRIAESVLQKIMSQHMNALSTHSTPRNKSFTPFSVAQTNIHPPVADHPTLRKNWQNGIAKRALKSMKTLGNSSRNTLSYPEALTGQWRLMLDGPQAPQGQLVRLTAPKTKADEHSLHHTEPTATNIAKEIPVGPLAMNKGSPGEILEMAEPGLPVSPATGTTDNARVTRKHARPIAPNMERRPERQPLPAAPDSDHSRTQPMPTEPVLDGLIREAAAGVPGTTAESLAPNHGPLPTNPPAPSEQTRLPLNKAQAATDPPVSDTAAAIIHPSLHREYVAAQSDLGDLADQIKRILDDEARRHGIDV